MPEQATCKSDASKKFIFLKKINQLPIGLVKIDFDKSTKNARNDTKIRFEVSRFPLTFLTHPNLPIKYTLHLYFPISFRLLTRLLKSNFNSPDSYVLLLLLGIGTRTISRHAHTLKYFKLIFLLFNFLYGIDCVLKDKTFYCFLYGRQLFVVSFCSKDSSSTQVLWQT